MSIVSILLGDTNTSAPTDRVIKKYLKKHENEFVPASADVYQMCETAGHPEYFTPIKNRIFREMETDKSVQSCVMVDLFDSETLRLPENGIVRFHDLLASYFDVKDIIALREYLHDQNEYRKNDYSINKGIKGTRTPVLKSWIKEWNKMEKENKLSQEAASLLKSKVNEELERRRKIFR